MVWLPEGEKIFLEDIFICFDRIPERDRQAHRQTPHDGIGCAYIASNGKNWIGIFKTVILFCLY